MYCNKLICGLCIIVNSLINSLYIYIYQTKLTCSLLWTKKLCDNLIDWRWKGQVEKTVGFSKLLLNQLNLTVELLKCFRFIVRTLHVRVESKEFCKLCLLFLLDLMINSMNNNYRLCLIFWWYVSDTTLNCTYTTVVPLQLLLGRAQSLFGRAPKRVLHGPLTYCMILV